MSEITTRPTPSEEFWEPHYAQLDSAWAAHPNVVLERVVTSALGGSAVGTALEVGCGHGADAVWLASLGWQVTAVDVSATAVARTLDRARKAGLEDRVTGSVVDLTQEMPEGLFDLVTASYFQTPVPIDRAGTLRRIAGLIAPGGTLVVVEHASLAPWSWNRGPTDFPTPEQTLASIGLTGGWFPVEVRVGARLATGPLGESAEVLDNIIVVRREH
ncbi:MAG TPA: class I SAM-dependent methyltransferase [Glaciihabitans sp.]|jgi:SAM-dependent methyltransferase|nr:class I SAM-dependent methyltransferase [Glaciihabitans sp.]